MTDDEFYDFLDKLDEEEETVPDPKVEETARKKRSLQAKQNAAYEQGVMEGEEEERTKFGTSNTIGNIAKGIVSGTPVGSFLDEFAGLVYGEQGAKDFRDAEAAKAASGEDAAIQAFSPIVGAALPFGSKAAATVPGAMAVGGASGVVHGLGNEEDRLGSAAIEGLLGAGVGGLASAGANALAQGLAKKIPSLNNSVNPVGFLEDFVGNVGKATDNIKGLQSRVSVSAKPEFDVGPVKFKVAPEMKEHPIIGKNVRRPTPDVPEGYKAKSNILPIVEDPGTMSVQDGKSISLARPKQVAEGTNSVADKDILSASEDDYLYPLIGNDRVSDTDVLFGSQADTPEARALMNEIMNPRTVDVSTPPEQGGDILDSMFPADVEKMFPKISSGEVPDTSNVRSSPGTGTQNIRKGSKQPVEPKREEMVLKEEPKKMTEIEEDPDLFSNPGMEKSPQVIDEDPDLFSSPGIQEEFMQPQQVGPTPEEFQAQVMKLKEMGYDFQQIMAMLEGKMPPPADYMAMAMKGSNKPGQARAMARKDAGTYQPKKKQPKMRPTFNPKKK